MKEKSSGAGKMKAPTMGGVELSKAPDGAAIEKGKPTYGSSRVEGQDRGGMENNLSVKSELGKVCTY